MTNVPQPRPRERTRTFLRRAGKIMLACAVLLVITWLASAFYGIAAGISGKEALVLNRGWVEIDWEHLAQTGRPFPRGVEFFPSSRIGWRHDAMWFTPATAPWHTIGFPIWWPAVPLLITALALIRLFPRHLPNHCKYCRYNLTGLPPNAPCPECGTLAAPIGNPPQHRG